MEHTLQHPTGLAHLIFAILAILIGAAVVFMRKGTKKHRWIGRAYVFMMLAVNATALMIYELFGGWGMFHWAALLSLVSLVFGYIPAYRKKPGWRVRHAYWITGSYVGLMSAFAAETLTRYSPWPFTATVVIVSFAVSFVGIGLMFRYIPPLVR